MTTAVMMDTLQISRRLRDAGASETVAEAMATTFAESTAIVREDLATKADLLSETGSLRRDIEALESRIDNRILASENRLLASQNRLLIWIAGMLIASIGATVTLIKALG